jgi:hypothetical protein
VYEKVPGVRGSTTVARGKEGSAYSAEGKKGTGSDPQKGRKMTRPLPPAEVIPPFAMPREG